MTSLSFLGGTRTVTGSRFLIETGGGDRVLVDCGLFQGPKALRERNWAPFPVPPSSINAVLLTHAHVDHCGWVPRLAGGGFAGPVWATPGTADLVRIVLPDSGHLQEEEAAFANRRGYTRHDPALPLYTEKEARDSLGLLREVAFDDEVEIVPGVVASWQRAGHILGAASIHLRVDGRSGDQAIVVSGDLGRSTHPLLRPPEDLGAADIVLCESTYGDRHHPEDDNDEVLAEVVGSTADQGGVVVIPAFAVDRTEVVLWHLDRLTEAGRIPELPVFVDSPMALRALDVYREAARERSPELRPELHGEELFTHLDLRESRTVEDSKAINGRRGPFIVVSASGMASGGRVLHHLAGRIGHARNTILLVGFQARETRGDHLARGAKSIKVLGAYRRVRARVVRMDLSAHADQDDLVAWLATASPPPETVFVVHGEEPASWALADRLDAEQALLAVVPRPDERISLDHY